MQPSDIAILLKNFGFSGLSLVKTEGTNYTFKFDDFNLKKLNSMFGTPSIAGGGKVAVFVVPEYGKLGVSPINRMVRLAYTGTHQKTEYDDTHLGQHETTQELNLLYEKAKVNPAQKTKFITALWEYFNEEKFQGRLPVPRLMTSLKPPVDGVSKNVRGLFIYDTKKLYGPGTLWISDRIFNAKEAFINEVVLHEMCHQATSCLDKVNDPSEGGHGREWQAWMRRVGLDPRRFDPTEETVYQDKATQAISEDKLNRAYGPRTPVAEYKNLEKVSSPTSLEVLVLIKGRLMRGKFKKVRGGYEFHCVAPNNANLIFTFKAFPKDRTYKL
jgi:hypothetical protein